MTGRLLVWSMNKEALMVDRSGFNSSHSQEFQFIPNKRKTHKSEYASRHVFMKLYASFIF